MTTVRIRNSTLPSFAATIMLGASLGVLLHSFLLVSLTLLLGRPFVAKLGCIVQRLGLLVMKSGALGRRRFSFGCLRSVRSHGGGDIW